MTTNANHIQAKHQQAMLLAQDALAAMAHGHAESALKLYELAFELEREAALAMHTAGSIEPLRSVLFRSAAALAMRSNHLREAEQMIGYGLAGNPPEDVAEEMRAINRQLIRLRKDKQEQPASPNGISYHLPNEAEVPTEVIYGTLAVADADKKQIKIAKANQQRLYNKIKVPDNLTNIVQQYFGQLVCATVRRNEDKGSFVLVTIERS